MKKLLLLCFQMFLAQLLMAQSLYTLEQLSQLYEYTSVAEALEAAPEEVYRINLSKQKLTSIPAEIKQFTNLQELNLSNNKITTIDSILLAFPNLQKLIVSKNKIEFLSNDFCQAKHLKYVDLSQNQLYLLPLCMGDLTELEYLDIWNNSVERFPDSFSQLTKLKTLDIRGIVIPVDEIKKLQAALPDLNIEYSGTCNCAK